jgi:hypothetical protein
MNMIVIYAEHRQPSALKLFMKSESATASGLGGEPGLLNLRSVPLSELHFISAASLQEHIAPTSNQQDSKKLKVRE